MAKATSKSSAPRDAAIHVNVSSSSRSSDAPTASSSASTAATSDDTQRLLDDIDHETSTDNVARKDLTIHPGRASEGDTLPGLDPLTPRTPSKVRFNLHPDIVPPPKTEESESTGPEDGRNSLDRDSLDFDDDPMYSSYHPPSYREAVGSSGAGAGEGRRLLLTDMEAPAVALANSLGGMTDEEVAERLDREHRRPRSGMKAAFMNMANSIIGAGIIGQPYAFRQAGLLMGILLLVGLTIVVDWTITLIVVNSKLSGRDSFQGTVEACFGRKGLIAISIAQWAFAFGGMVAFGVIIGDSIPHVLAAIWPDLGNMPVLGLLASRRAVIVISILGISLPLAMYRDIAKLAKASTLALISMLVILVTVLVQGALVPSEDRGSFNSSLLIINDGFFQAIGVISFAFVCHHNSLLIYGSLKTPTLDRFKRVTHYSTGISMMACLLMALAGFLTFGDKTLGNVLNNFSPDNTMVNIARLCFGLNMLTTLPLEAFVCREVMFNYFYPDKPFNLKLHVLFSSGLVVGAMLISLTTCDLGVVFELVGATSACALAYILPPLCYIRLSTRSWKTGVAWAVVVFGAAVFCISVFQAISKLVSGGGESAQCV